MNIGMASASMEQDMAAQCAWLTQQACTRGFADLDDLLRWTPEVYMQLAEQWRHGHHLVGVPLAVACGR